MFGGQPEELSDVLYQQIPGRELMYLLTSGRIRLARSGERLKQA
jgi:hypothetical protein